MARVVVAGGGLGGMASAARLAKLGHDVTLVEARDALGGALVATAVDGFAWGPTSTLLPAVLRDLFRKTGRPLERELELTPLEVVREHRFTDGSSVRLPGGSRAAQLRAVEALGPGLGDRWIALLDELASDWEMVRRGWAEVPYDDATATPELRHRLATRTSVHRRIARLGDPRLRLLATDPLVSAGQDPRRVPAWLAVWPYLEQCFGAWRVTGGLPAVAAALGSRLATRRVTVELDTRVLDVAVRGGRAVGVTTDRGDLDADVVVCAVDPRLLPALAGHVRRTRPVEPSDRTHLGLRPDPASDVGESVGKVVWHGRTDVTVHPGTDAPDGLVAVTLEHRGHGVDPLDALAEHGPDLRDRVVARVDDPAAGQVARWSGSPWGVQWRGRGTLRHRLGPGTPVPGVLAAGAHATPGAGVPFVGLSAALVAQTLGPA
ncbi:MAG: NAD(P)/FAD-dependent oxidoreductase [Nocardioidaceae bacterium]